MSSADFMTVLYTEYDYTSDMVYSLLFVYFSKKLLIYFPLLLWFDAIQQQPFNGLFSRTTWVRWYQKCKTNLDFTGARDSEWQWHQLGHMQVCTSLQTDYHASTPPLCFYRPDALPAAQPTASKHWRQGFDAIYLCKFYRLQLFDLMRNEVD